jgi:hypothetical protein
VAFRGLALCCGVALVAILGPAVFPVAAAGQQLPWQVRPSGDAANQPVQYTYPEQIELTVGSPQEVDLHFHIREGLHINSHKPLDASFIRTELIVAEPPGIDVEAVDFPPGAPYASQAFPGHKLSVYTGDLILRARILAQKPGEHMLPAALRYQACDLDSCLPPKKAPVALDIVAR